MQNIGHESLYLTSVDSTNTYLQSLDSSEKVHGLVVYTYNQTQGRGQRDKTWSMEAGSNLALSIFLQDELPKLENQYALNALIALAIANVVESLTKSRVYIKWPNDVIVLDKKVAGILIENVIQGDFLKESVVGIGLNVNQKSWEGLESAISLSTATDATLYDLESVRLQLLEQIQLLWDKFLGPDYNAIWSAYNNKLYKGGVIKTPEGMILKPISVHRDGYLLTSTQAGIHKAYKHGEILWLLDR